MTGLDIAQDPELSAFVAAKAEELHVPGASVGVVHGDRTYAATHGVTSTQDPLEVDLDTLFMIGSTSKTLTATALMVLVDRGTLTLKDRVIDHLPDFRVGDAEATQTVTVEQLLNHTAGWRGDALPQTGFGDDALARAMDVVAEGPQEYPPGRYVSYNNASLLVAGHLVATLTGTTYEEAVADLVLLPLGMTNTFASPWDTAQRRAAVGHVVTDGVATAVPIWPLSRAIVPAGGVLSSLRDQLAYLRYHLDGTTTGTAPLLEETRLLMQEPTADCRSTLTGVGLSWLLSDYGDRRMVAHGGNVSNLQTSAFHFLPDARLGVTVMGNSRYGAVLGKEVLQWAIEHYLGAPPRPHLPTLPLTPELIADYVGEYDLGPWSWGVTTQDGKLFTEMILPDGTSDEIRAAFAAPPTEMVLVGEDQLAPAAAPVEASADFVRDASGRVAWFRHGMRMAPVKKSSVA